MSRSFYIGTVKELTKTLKPFSKSQDAEAAVALLLKTLDQTLEVFLVKRVEDTNDPWSGQIALPGGKRKSEDKTLKKTIIRETLEETNINLLDRCRFLGVLESFRSVKRPKMRILPFVVYVEHEPSVKLNNELKWFTWISLNDLVRNKGTVKFNLEEYPAYIVGNDVVWGLTYRILERLIERRNG